MAGAGVAPLTYTSLDLVPYVSLSAFFFLIMPYIWDFLGSRLISSYSTWSFVNKLEWRNRLNSMLHAFAVVPYIFYLITTDPALSSPDLMARSWAASLGVAFSCGYFVWDIIEVCVHLEQQGVAFLIHAIYCLGVYAIATFGQMMLRHALLYLLFEISTVFFNIHWFLTTIPKTPLKRLIGINGLFLIVSYFFARILFGYYHTYYIFWPDALSLIKLQPSYFTPTFLMTAYILVASVAANGLNTVWFVLILKAAVGGEAAPAPPQIKSKKN